MSDIDEIIYGVRDLDRRFKESEYPADDADICSDMRKYCDALADEVERLRDYSNKKYEEIIMVDTILHNTGKDRIEIVRNIIKQRDRLGAALWEIRKITNRKNIINIAETALKELQNEPPKTTGTLDSDSAKA